jgi:hypothetical protein
MGCEVAALDLRQESQNFAVTAANDAALEPPRRLKIVADAPLLDGPMPIFVVPLAGPFGLILLLVIAWMSL